MATKDKCRSVNRQTVFRGNKKSNFHTSLRPLLLCTTFCYYLCVPLTTLLLPLLTIPHCVPNACTRCLVEHLQSHAQLVHHRDLEEGAIRKDKKEKSRRKRGKKKELRRKKTGAERKSKFTPPVFRENIRHTPGDESPDILKNRICLELQRVHIIHVYINIYIRIRVCACAYVCVRV